MPKRLRTFARHFPPFLKLHNPHRAPPPTSPLTAAQAQVPVSRSGTAAAYRTVSRLLIAWCTVRCAPCAVHQWYVRCSYLQPFPNYWVIGSNLKYFASHGVKGVRPPLRPPALPSSPSIVPVLRFDPLSPPSHSCPIDFESCARAGAYAPLAMCCHVCPALSATRGERARERARESTRRGRLGAAAALACFTSARASRALVVRGPVQSALRCSRKGRTPPLAATWPCEPVIVAAAAYRHQHQ